jgi:hypothetical protein
MCTSFKAEVLLGVHDFRSTGGDMFKLALYSSMANLDANTTSYTTVGEVTGTNYTAGGAVLTNGGVTASNASASSGVGFATFSNVTFANSTITARGALIYNTTPSANGTANTTLTNAAVMVLDFGSDKVSSSSSFTVTFPTATNTTAIVRIS